MTLQINCRCCGVSEGGECYTDNPDECPGCARYLLAERALSLP